MSDLYACGEPITAARIQEEPWYSDYQSVAEVLCAGPDGTYGGGVDGNSTTYGGGGGDYFERLPDGFERAKKACRAYFKRFPGPPGWERPNDERLERWINSMWLNDADIGKIEKCRAQEESYSVHHDQEAKDGSLAAGIPGDNAHPLEAEHEG